MSWWQWYLVLAGVAYLVFEWRNWYHGAFVDLWSSAAFILLALIWPYPLFMILWMYTFQDDDYGRY